MLTTEELAYRVFKEDGLKSVLPFVPLPMADIGNVGLSGHLNLVELYCNVAALTKIELNFDRVVSSKHVAEHRRADREFSVWLDQKYTDGAIGPGDSNKPGLLVLTFSTSQITFDMKGDYAYEKMGLLHDILVISWFNYEKHGAEKNKGVREYSVFLQFEERSEWTRRVTSLEGIFYVGCAEILGQGRELFIEGCIKQPISVEGSFNSGQLAEFVSALATEPAASITLSAVDNKPLENSVQDSPSRYTVIELAKTDLSKEYIDVVLINHSKLAAVGCQGLLTDDGETAMVTLAYIKVASNFDSLEPIETFWPENFKPGLIECGERVRDSKGVAELLSNAQLRWASCPKVLKEQKEATNQCRLVTDNDFIWLQNYAKVRITATGGRKGELKLKFYWDNPTTPDRVLSFMGIDDLGGAVDKVINVLQTGQDIILLRCEDGVMSEYELTKKG